MAALSVAIHPRSAQHLRPAHNLHPTLWRGFKLIHFGNSHRAYVDNGTFWIDGPTLPVGASKIRGKLDDFSFLSRRRRESRRRIKPSDVVVAKHLDRPGMNFRRKIN